MFAFRVEVSKEKKALETEYDAVFEVIFNYSYGCCAFAHNIYGSKPGIPAGMSDTSNPLPPDFFVNPRCHPDVVPGEAAAAPKADISGEVEHSSTVGAKVGDNPDSLSRVVGESEEPVYLTRVRDCILCLSSLAPLPPFCILTF